MIRDTGNFNSKAFWFLAFLWASIPSCTNLFSSRSNSSSCTVVALGNCKEEWIICWRGIIKKKKTNLNGTDNIKIWQKKQRWCRINKIEINKKSTLTLRPKVTWSSSSFFWLLLWSSVSPSSSSSSSSSLPSVSAFPSPPSASSLPCSMLAQMCPRDNREKGEELGEFRRVGQYLRHGTRHRYRHPLQIQIHSRAHHPSLSNLKKWVPLQPLSF